MFSIVSRSIRAYLFLALVPVAALADWEASFTAQSSKSSFSSANGKFYAKADQVRVDSNVPVEVSFYARSGSDHVDAAIHSFHMRLTTKLGKSGDLIPRCFAKTFDECEKQYSLKKIREENCGEGGAARTCEVYASSSPNVKGVKKIEVSHWKGETEPVLVSSVVTKTDGDVITAKFTKFSRRSHEVGFFSVPAGYVNAGSLDKFIGGFKGKSE